MCPTSWPNDLRKSASKVGVKGYYCGPFEFLGGRRHDSIIFDLGGASWNAEEFARFWHWVIEVCLTKLPPSGGGIRFV